MRISRYSHFIPWSKDHLIAYNARSGGMAVMTTESYARYTELARKIESGETGSLTADETVLIDQLRHGSFVCESRRDELDELHFWHNMARYDRSMLSLSILPTLACNMACRYCYEGEKKGLMSDEIIDQTIQFVQEQSETLRLLAVNWFGGEPLLAMNIIERFGKVFVNMQQEHKLMLNSIIVTNGYLLTKDTVDRLKTFGVQGAQITLDGPASIHDVKRPLKNGGKSFRTIVDNITYACDHMRIAVRVNIDKDTSAEIFGQLLTELEQAGLREKIGVNFGHIEPLSAACSDISEACYNVIEFAKVETDFFRILSERGFLVSRLPMPAPITCISQHVNSFLVDPLGRLYKCFAQVGDPSKSIGRIGEAVQFDHPNFTSLFDFDPYTSEECRSCSILPVCTGGCPEIRTHSDRAKEEHCCTWKYNLQPMVDIIAHSRLHQDGTIKGK